VGPWLVFSVRPHHTVGVFAKADDRQHVQDCCCGVLGVGKSAIVQRLVDGTFREETQSTVGSNSSRFLSLSTIKLSSPRSGTPPVRSGSSLSRAHFRNAVGGVLVFDTASDASFDDLDEWLHDLQQLANPNALITLVGNKFDVDAQLRREAQARLY
jgi:GTPase SAR1 family protein